MPISGFNIYATFNDTLNEEMWYLSHEPLRGNMKLRLEQAYTEVRMMFISDNPFILTLSLGRPPTVGEISPGVFFCPAERFRFGGYTLINSPFWDKCMTEKQGVDLIKLGFVDSLSAIGVLMNNNKLEEQLRAWEQEHGFHCFNVFMEAEDGNISAETGGIEE